MALSVSRWVANAAEDDKMIPVHLLVFATHLVASTLVCFVEVWAAKDWPKEDINKNLPGYLVFFVVGTSHLLRQPATHDNLDSATVLWVDMFSRVKTGLTGKTKLN